MFNDWHFKQLALPALLLAALLINKTFIQPPAPLPADSDASVFSAERAMEHVRKIAVEPHAVGTPANKRVRDMLVAHLNAAGLETEIQSTQILGSYQTDRADFYTSKPQRHPVAYVNNVVARLKGTGQKGKALVLMSHYDSVYYGPGAGDDASGTATLLETLRAIQAGPLLENDVIFLFTDAEEVGLFGAQAYFSKHRWAKETGLILNFEARGSRGPVSLFQTSPTNDKLVAAFREVADKPFGNSLTVKIYQAMPNDTDLSISLKADMPGMNFAFIDGFYDYHTEGDNIENLSPATLQHMGDQALAMTRAMGNQKLPLEDTSEVVFFDVLTLFLISYPIWGSWIVMALAVIALIVFSKNKLTAKQVSLKGTLKSSVAALLFVLSFALIVEALFLLIGGRSGETVEGRRLFALADQQLLGFVLVGFGLALGWFRMMVRGFTAIWMIGGALLSLILFILEPTWIPAAVSAVATIIAYFLLRTPVSSDERLLASLDMYLLAALAAQIFVPTGSFLVMWPFIFVVLSLILYERGKIGFARVCLLSLLSALWPIFYTEMGYSALGIFLPSIIAPIFGLLLLMLVPTFLHITGNSHRTVATFSNALGLALVVFVANATGFTERFNQPTEAFYIVDGKDDGTNQFGSRIAALDEWSTQLLESDPTSVAATSFVPHLRGNITMSDAPMSAVQKVSIREAEVGGGRIVFTLKPGYRGDFMVVGLESSAPMKEILVNGEPLGRGDNPSASIILYYFAVPETGLKLNIASDGELSVHAAELTSDWPQDIAGQIPAKPSTMMKAPYRMSDSTLSFVKHTFSNKPPEGTSDENR